MVQERPLPGRSFSSAEYAVHSHRPLRERRADLPIAGRALRGGARVMAGTHGDRRRPDRRSVLPRAQGQRARAQESASSTAQAAKTDRRPLGLKDLPPHVWKELAQSGFAAPCADRSRRTRSLPQPRMLQDSGMAFPCAFRSRSAQGWNLNRCLSHCEREIVAGAMRQTRNNQSQAARLLGLTPRSIYNKLRKHQPAAQIQSPDGPAPENSFPDLRFRLNGSAVPAGTARVRREGTRTSRPVACFDAEFQSRLRCAQLLAHRVLRLSATREGMVTTSTPEQSVPDIRNRLVNFKVRDVYIPDAREILVELYGNDILQGRVLDLTDSGTAKQAFAVVEVEGVSHHVIVPMERILGVLVNGAAMSATGHATHHPDTRAERQSRHAGDGGDHRPDDPRRCQGFSRAPEGDRDISHRRREAQGPLRRDPRRCSNGCAGTSVTRATSFAWSSCIRRGGCSSCAPAIATT